MKHSLDILLSSSDEHISSAHTTSSNNVLSSRDKPNRKIATRRHLSKGHDNHFIPSYEGIHYFTNEKQGKTVKASKKDSKATNSPPYTPNQDVITTPGEIPVPNKGGKKEKSQSYNEHKTSKASKESTGKYTTKYPKTSKASKESTGKYTTKYPKTSKPTRYPKQKKTKSPKKSKGRSLPPNSPPEEHEPLLPPYDKSSKKEAKTKKSSKRGRTPRPPTNSPHSNPTPSAPVVMTPSIPIVPPPAPSHTTIVDISTRSPTALPQPIRVVPSLSPIMSDHHESSSSSSSSSPPVQNPPQSQQPTTTVQLAPTASPTVSSFVQTPSASSDAPFRRPTTAPINGRPPTAPTIVRLPTPTMDLPTTPVPSSSLTGTGSDGDGLITDVSPTFAVESLFPTEFPSLSSSLFVSIINDNSSDSNSSYYNITAPTSNIFLSSSDDQPYPSPSPSSSPPTPTVIDDIIPPSSEGCTEFENNAIKKTNKNTIAEYYYELNYHDTTSLSDALSQLESVMEWDLSRSLLNCDSKRRLLSQRMIQQQQQMTTVGRRRRRRRELMSDTGVVGFSSEPLDETTPETCQMLFADSTKNQKCVTIRGASTLYFTENNTTTYNEDLAREETFTVLRQAMLDGRYTDEENGILQLHFLGGVYPGGAAGEEDKTAGTAGASSQESIDNGLTAWGISLIVLGIVGLSSVLLFLMRRKKTRKVTSTMVELVDDGDDEEDEAKHAKKRTMSSWGITEAFTSPSINKQGGSQQQYNSPGSQTVDTGYNTPSPPSTKSLKKPDRYQQQRYVHVVGEDDSLYIYSDSDSDDDNDDGPHIPHNRSIINDLLEAEASLRIKQQKQQQQRQQQQQQQQQPLPSFASHHSTAHSVSRETPYGNSSTCNRTVTTNVHSCSSATCELCLRKNDPTFVAVNTAMGQHSSPVRSYGTGSSGSRSSVGGSGSLMTPTSPIRSASSFDNSNIVNKRSYTIDDTIML